MMRSKKPVLSLESLEERLTPAFDFFYNPAGDAWTITQVQDDGDATIAVSAGNVLSVTEGSTVSVGEANGSVTINMLDNSSGMLTVDLDGALFGNVSVDLGHGTRTLGMTATGGGPIAIFGNLSVRGGTGIQTVALNVGVDVGGAMSIDSGPGVDSVFFLDSVSVGSSLTMRNVNDFADGGMGTVVSVGSNFNFYANQENQDNFFTLGSGFAPGVGATVAIGGNFNYLGGNGDELVLIGDGTTGGNVFIGGSASFQLANGLGLAGFSNVDLLSTVIGRNLTVIGGTTPVGGGQFVSTDLESIIGGNVLLSMGAIGDNLITLEGTIGGSSVSIIGGMGIDLVTYSMVGSNVRLYSSLSLGDDTFLLAPDLMGNNPTLSYLYIDFGFGSDTFANAFIGPFTFRTYLRNLP